jgi:hypothetical protein
MKDELSEKEQKLWAKIGKYDPLLFSRGYSAEKIEGIIKGLDEGFN